VWDPLKLFRQPRTALGRAIAWIRSRLVDDWNQALRWWSVRLALLGGLIVGLVTDPGNALMIVNLLYSMPPEYRWFVSPVVGFAVAAIPILLRLWKQPQDKADG